MRRSAHLLALSLTLAGAVQAAPPGGSHPLAESKEWDDGLAEMSYFTAVDWIYDEVRSYTRVIIVNRQWMSPSLGVKTTQEDASAVAVFKMNIAEEIPTQNYNYRYLTTVFLTRPALHPFKMVTSSQEWCGTTFKHLRWSGEELNVHSYSYFPDEGDKEWTLPADAVPYEALYLVARDTAAGGTTRQLNVLLPMRSNREVAPQARPADLVVEDVGTVRVPAGSYPARRVTVRWEGPETWFEVEVQPPCRLLRYRAEAQEGTLERVERRPYWDRGSRSRYYRQGHAP